MARKNAVTAAIEKIKAEIEAQTRVLYALEAIQRAQGTVGKRTRKARTEPQPTSVERTPSGKLEAQR